MNANRPAGVPGPEPDLKTDTPSAPEDAVEAVAAPVAEAAPRAGAGTTILVCHSCRGPQEDGNFPRPGTRLAEDTERAAAGTGLSVTRVGCLGNCKRGNSAAMLRPGSWSYVFGGLSEQAGADLVAGALLYASASDGFMPFRARPESLKRGLIARVPTFDHLSLFDTTPPSE